MEGWKYYEGKDVYLILKNGRQYQGKVIKVDSTALPLVWITIIDKKNMRVTFVHSEIDLIQEEEK